MALPDWSAWAILVGVILAAIVVGLRPLLARLAARNIGRRKSRVLIVVAGLLVGTAIISSSLVVGDTLSYIFLQDVYVRLGAVDELVSNAFNGQLFSFAESNATQIASDLAAVRSPVDGIAPVLLKVMPVRNIAGNKGNQQITVLGLNASAEGAFGPLTRLDGRPTDTNVLGPVEVFANERAAADLNATPGEDLTLFYGTTNQTIVHVSVAAIVRDVGKAAYGRRAILFMDLGRAQAAFNESGAINLIRVSNVGGVAEGVASSEQVTHDLRLSIAKNHLVGLQVDPVKASAIAQAVQVGRDATDLFLVMGAFGILAGVLLIVNIFVMLAEERKPELGIARAVRVLPEPGTRERSREVLIAGALIALTGAILTAWGFAANTGMGKIPGPPVLAIGIGIAAVSRGWARAALTLAAAINLTWILMPVGLLNQQTDNVSVAFVMTGVILVGSGILIAVFNISEALRALLRRANRGAGRPVLKTAISYPMDKRFRTGMTVAMFALILFMVTLISMLQGLQASSLESFVQQQSGGYDVIAYTTTYSEIPNFRESLRANVNESSGQREALTTRDQVWLSLRYNHTLAIVDRTAAGPNQFVPDESRLRLTPGDQVRAYDFAGRSVNLTIVGVLAQALQFTSGVFVDESVVRTVFPPAERYTAYFFQMSAGVDVAAFRADLERVYFAYGLQTIDIREAIGEEFDSSQQVLTLMQAYLGIGIFVGIAGLAVITLRAVVERRTQIGALRAIGFTQRMVLATFLGEIALIAVLGIGIGVALGIVFAYKIYVVYFADIVVFSVPWPNLALIVGLTAVAAVGATAQPAIRASRIPPAEALRYIE